MEMQLIAGEICEMNIPLLASIVAAISRDGTPARARHGLLLTPTKSVVTFTSQLCVTVIARNALVLKHLTTARARTLRAHIILRLMAPSSRLISLKLRRARALWTTCPERPPMNLGNPNPAFPRCRRRARHGQFERTVSSICLRGTRVCNWGRAGGGG